jgi:hypothetical protein
MKAKKCRNCLEKFEPKNSLQVVCGIKCSIEYNKTKKEKQAVKFKEYEQEHKEEKSLKASLINTKMQVHEYVRLRDKGKPCISCGVAWTSTFQCGHHYKSETFTTLRFNLDNLHGQCQRCNLFLEGAFENYALNLPFRIGIKKYNDLQSLASIDKQFKKVWNLENLKEIREKVKKLRKDLRD